LTPICTKSFVGWGFDPDPSGGAYSAPPAVFTGATSKGRGGRGVEGRGEERKGEKGKGWREIVLCPRKRKVGDYGSSHESYACDEVS